VCSLFSARPALTKHRRFHSQLFANGTLCELTGAARSAEVRYVCATEGMQGIGGGGEPVLLSSYIDSVKEPSTCMYVITFATPQLCESTAFRPAEEDVARINCHPHLPSS